MGNQPFSLFVQKTVDRFEQFLIDAESLKTTLVGAVGLSENQCIGEILVRLVRFEVLPCTGLRFVQPGSLHLPVVRVPDTAGMLRDKIEHAAKNRDRIRLRRFVHLPFCGIPESLRAGLARMDMIEKALAGIVGA